MKVTIHMNPDDIAKPGKMEIEGTPTEIFEYLKISGGFSMFGK